MNIFALLANWISRKDNRLRIRRMVLARFVLECGLYERAKKAKRDHVKETLREVERGTAIWNIDGRIRRGIMLTIDDEAPRAIWQS